MNRKVVAIHQPNFFPWLGFFDRIVRSDVFILMDNAQMPKTGSTWTNRVYIIVGGQPAWARVQAGRAYQGTRLIKDIKVDNSKPWRKKLLRTLQINYARAPFLEEALPYLTELVNNPAELLSEYNIFAIRSLVDKLQLDSSKFILGSSLNSRNVEEDTPDLLVDMIKAVGGTAYLCGGAAWGYQETLGQAGIEVIYQDFVHPGYPQCNTAEFIPGLSIIDTLMNVGFDGVKAMLAGTTSASR